jgi:hypothetical protein
MGGVLHSSSFDQLSPSQLVVDNRFTSANSEPDMAKCLNTLVSALSNAEVVIMVELSDSPDDSMTQSTHVESPTRCVFAARTNPIACDDCKPLCCTRERERKREKFNRGRKKYFLYHLDAADVLANHRDGMGLYELLSTTTTSLLRKQAQVHDMVDRAGIYLCMAVNRACSDSPHNCMNSHRRCSSSPRRISHIYNDGIPTPTHPCCTHPQAGNGQAYSKNAKGWSRDA